MNDAEMSFSMQDDGASNIVASADALKDALSEAAPTGPICGSTLNDTVSKATPTDAVSAVLAAMPDEEMLYDLADLFKVFADTTRIKILYTLMESELCVADIAAAVGVSQSAVSHQLRILKQAHLVKFRKEGKQIIYSLSDDHVHTVLSQGMTHICE